MSELKPCPFCGGEAEMCHVTQLWEPRDAYWVKCKNCRINGTHHTTEAEAIAAWNTRVERTCRNTDDDCDAWFECSECGLHSKLEIMSGGYGIPNYCPNCGAKVVSK